MAQTRRPRQAGSSHLGRTTPPTSRSPPGHGGSAFVAAGTARPVFGTGARLRQEPSTNRSPRPRGFSSGLRSIPVTSRTGPHLGTAGCSSGFKQSDQALVRPIDAPASRVKPCPCPLAGKQRPLRLLAAISRCFREQHIGARCARSSSRVPQLRGPDRPRCQKTAALRLATLHAGPLPVAHRDQFSVPDLDVRGGVDHRGVVRPSWAIPPKPPCSRLHHVYAPIPPSFIISSTSLACHCFSSATP